MNRLTIPAALLAATWLLAGCAMSGLSFRVDERVRITAPEDRATVSLPVTVEWSVADFDVTGPTADVAPEAGMFGVFVDRAPQPPGEPLEWFARDDDGCRATDGCPDAEYLEQRRVHATGDTFLVIEALPRPTTSRGPERHEVTVVLLDGQGHRLGESAWHVTFEVDRDTGGTG